MKQSLAQKVQSIYDTLQDTKSSQIHIDLELLEGLVHRYSAAVALEAALLCAPSNRKAVLKKAVEYRQKEGSGDRHLTLALLELGDIEGFKKSLVDEYLVCARDEQLPEEDFARFGLHVLRVFEHLDESVFFSWFADAHNAHDAGSFVRGSIRATGVPKELLKHKDYMAWLCEEAFLEWYNNRPLHT